MSDETQEELLERGELELEGKTQEQILEIVTLTMRKAMHRSLSDNEPSDVAKQLSKQFGCPVKIGTDQLDDTTVIVQLNLPSKYINIKVKI